MRPHLAPFGKPESALRLISFAKCFYRLEQAVDLILERILNKYRVVALGAGGEERDGGADKLFNIAHIAHRLRRQIGP